MCPLQGTPALQSSVSVYILGSLERSTVRVKCLSQEQDTRTQCPGLKPGLLNPKMSTLAMRPWHLVQRFF